MILIVNSSKLKIQIQIKTSWLNTFRIIIITNKVCSKFIHLAKNNLQNQRVINRRIFEWELGEKRRYLDDKKTSIFHFSFLFITNSSFLLKDRYYWKIFECLKASFASAFVLSNYNSKNVNLILFSRVLFLFIV